MEGDCQNKINKIVDHFLRWGWVYRIHFTILLSSFHYRKVNKFWAAHSVWGSTWELGLKVSSQSQSSKRCLRTGMTGDSPSRPTTLSTKGKYCPLLGSPLHQELDFETTEKLMLLTGLPPKTGHLGDSPGPAKDGNHTKPVSSHSSPLNWSLTLMSSVYIVF